MNTPDLKSQVLSYARRCYEEKLMAGTSGNLSALSEDGKLVITPSGIDYSKMSESDVMVIDLDGKILEGSHEPSSEWRLHAEIYKNLPDIKAVVHTHSPYATGFAVLNEPIPVILIEMMMFFGGDVPVSAYAANGTAKVGENAVETLKNRCACLMANHGVVAVAGELDKAYIRAVYVEDAAKIYHLSRCAGKPVILTREQQRELLNK